MRIKKLINVTSLHHGNTFYFLRTFQIRFYCFFLAVRVDVDQSFAISLNFQFFWRCLDSNPESCELSHPSLCKFWIRYTVCLLLVFLLSIFLHTTVLYLSTVPGMCSILQVRILFLYYASGLSTVIFQQRRYSGSSLNLIFSIPKFLPSERFFVDRVGICKKSLYGSEALFPVSLFSQC
jgi:hypothetical protein